MIKPSPDTWRVLQRGMSGHDVAAWQAVLKLSADGQFGSATNAQTRLFQVSHGLQGDGVVGPATRAVIDPSLFAPPSDPIPVVGLPVIRFLQAKYWRWANRKTVDWIVLHSAEVWEKPSSAEAVAAYFQNPPVVASSHFVVDCDSIVQCVKTEHVADHCGRGNDRSIGIEQAGYAKQSEAEWLDAYGQQMLGLVSKLVAREARQWNIPLVRLTPAELIAGKRGLCGHVDINAAFPNNAGHTDPGVHYPWDVLLEMARAA